MKLIPTTNDNYVGIEIECFGMISKSTLKKYLKESKIDSFVDIGSDGSITYSTKDFEDKDLKQVRTITGYGLTTLVNTGIFVNDKPIYNTIKTYKRPVHKYELRVLVKQNEMYKVLMSLQKVLIKANLKVNKSCGLHVHLDMRNRPYMLCANKLYKAQPLMAKLVKANRLRNTYCRLVKNEKQLFKNNTFDDRYKAINTAGLRNINKHTIEVRLHHGTVDMNEVYNWARFLITVVDSNIDFTKQDNYPKPVQKYFKEKIIHDQ